MAEVLGLGVTHYPRLAGPDATMAGTLERMLKDPGLPEQWRTPENWPEPMREEYGDDGGAAAAKRHRDQIVGGLREVRRRLDEFKPDVVVIWGDDQYENFREDIIPPFCVFAYDDLQDTPWDHFPYGPNIWGEADDHQVTVKGHRQAAKQLVSAVLGDDIDMAYAYQPLHHPGLAHAFLNTVMYLDYDRKGFDYPVIPVQVNCYGSLVIAQRGGLPNLSIQIPEEDLDPPAPSPTRCFDVGAAFARAAAASPWRVALVASASWSHGFLTPKNHFLWPDSEADARMLAALTEGRLDEWRTLTTEQVEASGQQEMLNWFCLAGAMSELGSKLAWHDFAETHVFNSNKCFAAFEPWAPK
jgi:hypothetical protein